jgi:hypothetical protein
MEMQMTDLHESLAEYPIEQHENVTIADTGVMDGSNQRPAHQNKRIDLSPPKRLSAPNVLTSTSRQRVQSAGRAQHGQNWPGQQSSGDKRPQSAEGFRVRRPGPHGPNQNGVPIEMRGREVVEHQVVEKHQGEHKVLDMQALVANRRKAWESKLITHDQLEARMLSEQPLEAAGQKWEWRPDSTATETRSQTPFSRAETPSGLTIWTYDFTK